MSESNFARIGKRTHDREALPPSIHCSLIKRFAMWFLHGIIGMFCMAMIAFTVRVL